MSEPPTNDPWTNFDYSFDTNPWTLSDTLPIDPVLQTVRDIKQLIRAYPKKRDRYHQILLSTLTIMQIQEIPSSQSQEPVRKKKCTRPKPFTLPPTLKLE